MKNIKTILVLSSLSLKLNSERFRDSYIDEIKKSTENLDPKKASQKSVMNTNIIRKNAAFFAKYTCDDINASMRSSKFHNELKERDIATLHKKKSKLSKKIMCLLVFFQISPRFIKDTYMKDTYIFLIISFQSISVVFEGISVQHCLLVMTEKWKKTVDNEDVFGVLLIDLSKALECILYDLIIAKLEAYVFRIDALTHSFTMPPFSTP